MHVLALALVLVHGSVLRGPTKPVCEMATPCSEPAAHLLLRFDGMHGHAVVRTDAAGRYSVRLRPGRYSVSVAPAPAIGRGLEPAAVTVRGPLRADFLLDTGIR